MADEVRDLGALLRGFAREALLPRSLFGRVVLLLVALRTPVVWLTSMWLRHEPVEVTAMYRPGGDIQYFEVVGAIGRGNFGESNVFEAAHQGLHGFPYGSSFLHDAAVAVAGSWGIFVADGVITILGYGAFVVLGRAATLSSRAAIAYAGGVAGFLYAAFTPLTDRLGWGRDLLWGERFPRPFLTEMYVALLLSILVPLATRKAGDGARAKPGVFAFGGVLLSLLAQSDIYNAFILGVLTAIVLGLRFVRSKEARRETIVGAVAMGVALAATVWPFLLQRRATPAEITTRWGTYPLTRLQALKWARFIPLSGPIVAAVVGAPAWLWLRREEASEDAGAASKTTATESTTTRRRRAVVLWVGVVFLAAISLPLFFVAISQGIFPYMFPDRVRRYAMLGATLVLATTASTLFRSAALRSLAARAWIPKVAGALVAVGMVGGIGMRAREIARREDHAKTLYRFGDRAGKTDSYRASFNALVAELKSPKYADAVVLGTLDQQVHVYWQAFAGRRSFVPDGFTSVASDAEIERRLILFCRALGMSTDAFLEVLQTESYQSMIFGGKYQANAANANWPLDDYTEAQRARIQRRNLFVSFQFEVPRSELARFRAMYEDPTYGGDPPRLDVIVLQRDDHLDALAPGDGWEPTFENAFFRVFRAVPR